MLNMTREQSSSRQCLDCSKPLPQQSRQSRACASLASPWPNFDYPPLQLSLFPASLSSIPPPNSSCTLAACHSPACGGVFPLSCLQRLAPRFVWPPACSRLFQHRHPSWSARRARSGASCPLPTGQSPKKSRVVRLCMSPWPSSRRGSCQAQIRPSTASP